MCHSLCVIVPLLPRQDMSVKTSNLLLQNFYKKRTITSIEPSKVCFYREDICFIFWQVSVYPGLSRRSVEPYLHCFFFKVLTVAKISLWLQGSHTSCISCIMEKLGNCPVFSSILLICPVLSSFLGTFLTKTKAVYFIPWRLYYWLKKRLLF